jgi:glycosyltransferase involved in cell wall biosynthesis
LIGIFYHLDFQPRQMAPATVLDQFAIDSRHFSAPAFSPGFGINLIGNFSGGVGLGVITRGIASLLKSREVPFSILDVPYAWGSPQPVSAFAGHLAARPDALSHPINLYVLPIMLFETFFQANPVFLVKERLHIANLWWEASRFPPHWIDSLARFDGILAMSDFIADVCRNSLPMTPTMVGEAPLDLPDNIRSDRKEFGLPSDAVVFVASLDPNCDPERKNPDALVTAFRDAFPAADQDVRLVIRLNNAATDVGQFTARSLLQLAEGDGRIGLLLEPMRYDEILSLYACADIYLSFHRGEGLGLGMLESMCLGKAVIATGWSGNLSFMNHSNSALLRYRLVPVSGNYGFFRPEVIGHDARWADPVHEDAVAWMRHLRHHPHFREALGAQARISALEYQRAAQKADWLTELDDLWQAHQHLPRVVEKLSFAASGTPGPSNLPPRSS